MRLGPRARVAIAAVLFSTGGAAIKGAPFSAWQIASLRSGVAAITILVLVPRAMGGIGWRPALVGVAYAATLVLFVLANRLTTSANTIYLQSTAPLYVVLLAPWLLHERIRRRDVPILIAVLGGLILVFLGADRATATATNPARGNFLAALSGVTYACLLCGLRWLGSDRDADRGLAAVMLGNVIACVATLPMALPIGAHSAKAWAGILYLGACQLALAYLLVASALRYLQAIETSLVLLVETALNPIWVWMLLGEVPTIFALIGGALIVGATIVQAVRSPSPTPAPEIL